MRQGLNIKLEVCALSSDRWFLLLVTVMAGVPEELFTFVFRLFDRDNSGQVPSDCYCMAMATASPFMLLTAADIYDSGQR